MRTPFFLTTTTIVLLTVLFYVSPLFILAVIGILTSFLIVLLALVFVPYLRELLSTDHRPPIIGPITNQLIHFQKLHDYMTLMAKKYPTYRLITPSHSEVYTVDPVNTEYILKTNFANYGKVLLSCIFLPDSWLNELTVSKKLLYIYITGGVQC